MGIEQFSMKLKTPALQKTVSGYLVAMKHAFSIYLSYGR
jgi:hypothetical protein